ncbi:hypothetical protein DLAC_11289 [Tieghemostelium lacteum]|uniref:Uncharacterized protein n=1 Tax=Tieghemostelium lacteum TaxID=361077 RepID=A0A151Z3M3_TIELA|nr:hypothetical protein DLAC_11289 [Tieghemostelium lacteum]|eukprot:KYQ88560.1 hypothetical protein DLAC_11289 [Tieghemostelium lacteum]
MLTVHTSYSSDLLFLANQITVDNFVNTYSGVLNKIVSRTGKVSSSSYNRWRNVNPTIASLLHWVLTGSPFAMGNPHVVNLDYTAGGNNHTNLHFTNEESHEIVETARSLFTYPEVQRAGFRVYSKKIIATKNNFTYVISLRWTFHEIHDSVVVEVRSFNQVLQLYQEDEDELAAKFQELGFGNL